MQKRIHMQDQVVNKVDAIMNHYNACPAEAWAAKFILVGVFLWLGVYW